MKRKYSKIMGVGLTLMLLTSLVGFVLPTSAAELEWKAETGMPSTSATKLQLASGSDITDIAVGNDGTTFYVADAEADEVYKSTDAGENWKAMDLPSGAGDIRLVAVAPDDADIVAVVADNNEVYVSVDGGGKFDDAGTTGLAYIECVAISLASAGAHNIAVGGDDGAVSDIAYYNLGATFANWTSMMDGTGWDSTDFEGTQDVKAIEFSPAFAGDKMLVAVTEENNNQVNLEMASLSSKKWNADAGFLSPRTISAVTGIAPLSAASLALSPDFYGGDDPSRISFVGIASSNASLGGTLMRVKNDVTKELKSAAIRSVDYDGVNLVAGSYDSNTVYRSDNMLDTSPEVPASSLYQNPSGSNDVDETVVAFADSMVVAGTTGDESAFAISEDNGKTFNDISLVDTTMTYLDDVAVAEDNSKIYLISKDGDNLSLWRKASVWTRVLALGDAGPNDEYTDAIVRLAPGNPDVVWLCDIFDGTDLFYSDDAGDTNWKRRALSAEAVDLAVESDKVAYALGSDHKVYKTTDGGFIWGTGKSTGVDGANIVSISEDNLIVGGDDGNLAYSTDGNASASTWKVKDNIFSSGNVQVAASGLEDGDFVYAASSVGDNGIKRWKVGDAPPGEWKKTMGDTVLTEGVVGLLLSADNVLYALEAGGGNSWIQRTLSPEIADDYPPFWSEEMSSETLGKSPRGLKSSPGSLKLWAIATEGDDELFAFTDTLYNMGPELISPPSGFTNTVNPITGRPAAIAFSWERPSKATNYKIYLSLDEKFTEKVVTLDVDPTPSSADPVVAMIGPYASGGHDAQEFEFQPGTKYYWRVKAEEPLLSPYSSTRNFEIEPALGVVPVINAPARGATGVPLMPAFAWSTVDGATSYTFQIALDAGFTSGGWTASGLTNNAYVAEQALTYGTTYYWRVTAYDGTTPMGDAAVGIFTTMEEPEEPAAPPPATTPAPPVEVTTVEAIPSYMLWIIIAIAIILVIALIVLIWRTRRAA